MRRFIEARTAGVKSVKLWGTGMASREFLHVRDAAEGVICAAETMDDPTPINLGTGREISIKELAFRLADLTGFQGEIQWDDSQPDGQPRRQLSVEKAERLLGWKAKINLKCGLKETFDWYQKSCSLAGK